KFKLFPGEREWMSSTQLLDLMRQRTQLKLVDLNLATQPNSMAIAFTLSFEYESPDAATKVANEFLTLILNEDARTRTSRAEETTKFLAREVSRLEGEVGSIDTRINEANQRPRNPAADQLASQLTELKSDLIQKTSLYSEAHPQVKAIKRKIAALEQLIAKTPQASQSKDLDQLKQQRLNVEKSLEEATRKLAAARMGESLERNQQSERLQVIEQPA